MIQLTQPQAETLRQWFLPEEPGPLVGLHVLNTGHGTVLADRWPHPRTMLAGTGGNYTLLGDPSALRASDLRPHVRGVLNTMDSLEPVIQAAFPDAKPWARILLAQKRQPEAPPIDAEVRRLTRADASALAAIGPDSAWITVTWDGAENLAASGYAWGAFVDGRLASVACTFFLGDRLEDIGIVTLPEYGQRGLSTACVYALCADVRARGRQATWATSTDNAASLRVAEKMGFDIVRRDTLYAVGVPIPQPIQDRRSRTE